MFKTLALPIFLLDAALLSLCANPEKREYRYYDPCYQADTRTHGTVLNQVTFTSLQDCKDLCTKTPGCKAAVTSPLSSGWSGRQKSECYSISDYTLITDGARRWKTAERTCFEPGYEEKQGNWRDDYKCGPQNGGAECNPAGEFPCCAPSGWCGKTDDHCKCAECVDYRDLAAEETEIIDDLGCWKDTSSRAIPTLEKKHPDLKDDYKSRTNAYAKCLKAAKTFGYKVFALQNGGWCASSENAQNTYTKYGMSNDCRHDGEGGPWSNQVYKIND